jgi:sugar lactone lactonase YvrE
MPGRLSQLPVITRLPAFIGSALVAVGATFVGAPGAAANDTAGAASASAPVSIALPGDRAFPESLASTKDGTLYVGSLASGGIYRIEPHSREAKPWIAPGTFGTHSTFGVLADEKAGILWVCSNDLSARGIAVAGSDGISALTGFDLKTGEGKISAPFPGKPSTCNDITIGPDEAAYVTNTAAPQILRLAPGSRQLEIWFTDPSLQPEKGGGLDGLSFGPDGNLYVDTVGPGELYRIDVKKGRATQLTKLTPSRQLVRADALRRYGKDRFLLIEGGGRLDMLSIRGDNVTVETLKDGYVVPTGVTAVGRTAWVSEGQLSFVSDPDKKPNLPFHIYSVDLPAAH